MRTGIAGLDHDEMLQLIATLRRLADALETGVEGAGLRQTKSQEPTACQKDMTAREAAQYLGFSKSTLDQWRCNRKKGSPKFFKLGYQVRYRQRDLDAWIASKAVTP